MTSPIPGQIESLLARTVAARSRLAAAALAAITPQWSDLDVYDAAAVAAFAAAAAATSQAAQDRATQLTEGFLRSVLTLMRTPTPVRALAQTGLPARLQVDPTAVYQRPAATVRYARSQDLGAEESASRGTRRLAQLVDTDVALASRNASQRVLRSVKTVTGWRRVLRPELSRGGSCGLCIAASDRIYSRGDLMALHDECHCITLPVTSAHDPGHELNRSDLAALYAAAGGADRDRIKRVRVATREHGELGPVLVDAAHAFRGPRDVAAA